MSDFFAFRTTISATVIQVVFVLGLMGNHEHSSG
jgi:hypothetical protein